MFSDEEKKTIFLTNNPIKSLNLRQNYSHIQKIWQINPCTGCNTGKSNKNGKKLANYFFIF